MFRKLLIATFILTLAVSGAASAATVSLQMDQLLAEGWQATSEDILQRLHDDGSVETIAFGRTGLLLEMSELQAQLDRVRTRLEETGDADLYVAIHHLEEQLAFLESKLGYVPTYRTQPVDGIEAQAIEGFDSLTTNEPTTIGCTTTVTRTASAYPTSTGPTANATARFQDSCGQWGEVYAYSYAEGYLGTVYTNMTQYDGPKSGYGYVNAYVSASVNADSNCYSYALARVRAYDDVGNLITWTVNQANYICRPFDAYLVNPKTSIYIPYGSCVTTSWSAAANQPVSTWAWTWAGVAVGSNSSSYSRKICSTYPTYTTTSYYTLKMTATASSGQSDFDSRSIKVTYEGSGIIICDDPCQPCFESSVSSSTSDLENLPACPIQY